MIRRAIHRTVLFGTFGLAVPAAIACNAILGIEAGELVDGGPIGGDASTDDGGATGGAGGRGAGGAAGGSGGAVAGSGGASGAGGGGMSGAGGSGGSGGIGGGGTSGAGGSVSGVVLCGSAQCATNGEACCRTPDTTFGNGSTQCVQTSAAMCSGLLSTCDDSSDCTNGEVCCLPFNADPAMMRVECTPDCLGATQQGYVVECMSPRNCPPPLECCEVSDGLRCTDQCQTPPVCQNDADCTSGQICASIGLSPFPRCVPPPDGVVQCGVESCDIAQGLVCCAPQDLMSQSRCDDTCFTSVETQRNCDDDGDCGGLQCCGRLDQSLTRLSQTVCATVCMGTEFSIDCTGAHNCPYPNYCCLAPGGTAATAVCRPEPCTQDGAALLCETDAECLGFQCLPIRLAGANWSSGLSACGGGP